MKFESFKKCSVLAISISSLIAFPFATFAQVAPDPIEVLRSNLTANRTSFIGQEMNLNPNQGEVFWPIYRDYRAEAEKVGDEITKLVLEYSDLYPDVPEDKGKEFLKRYGKAEAQLLKIKEKYLKKFGKVLPAAKVFRFAQLDNRCDLAVRLGLASRIPVLPGKY
jgi:hypothetical protein